MPARVPQLAGEPPRADAGASPARTGGGAARGRRCPPPDKAPTARRLPQIRTAPLGLAEEVSGSGVVGRQPVLAPGEAFAYTSACPLVIDPAYLARLPAHRSLGSMEGSYLMVAGPLGQELFAVRVAPFGFVLPPDVPPLPPS